MYVITNKEYSNYDKVLTKSSKHASGGKFNITAAIFSKKQLFCVGNYYPHKRAGSCVDISYLGMGVHAELGLLNKYDVTSYTMYIAGVNKNGNMICTKPCSRCNNLLLNSSLKYIIYADVNHELVKIKPSDLQLMVVRNLN